jgi:hypothetical protein
MHGGVTGKAGDSLPMSITVSLEYENGVALRGRPLYGYHADKRPDWVS